MGFCTSNQQIAPTDYYSDSLLREHVREVKAKTSSCHPEARCKQTEGPTRPAATTTNASFRPHSSHYTYLDTDPVDGLALKCDACPTDLLPRFPPPHPQHDPIPKRRTLHQTIFSIVQRRRSHRLTSRHIHPRRLILSGRQIQRNLRRPPPIHVRR